MAIKKYSDLDKLMKAQVAALSVKMGKKIQAILVACIQLLWYSEDPKQYERTFQVLESITVENYVLNKNTYVARVFFDEKKIAPASNIYERGPYQFNTHMSLDGETNYGGQSIGWWVVNWMEEGQNSKSWAYQGKHFVETAKEMSREDMATYIENELKKNNIKCITSDTKLFGITMFR